VPPALLRALVPRAGRRDHVHPDAADDVLDLTSEGTVSGKTPGTDLREKVPTMPVLLLRRRAATGDDPADAALVARLDGDLSDDADLAETVALLRAHDVVRETRERAMALVAEAVEILAPLPDGPVKDSFVSFADALVDRAS